MTGYITDIKAKPCAHPTRVPKDADAEEAKVGNLDTCEKATVPGDTGFATTGSTTPEATKDADRSREDMEKEVEALKRLEAELQLMEDIQLEEARLQSLLEQEAVENVFTKDPTEMTSTNEQHKKVFEKHVADGLVELGFTKELAALAVQQARGDWEKALGFAQSESKHPSGRPPASPCSGATMPPPPAPSKEQPKPCSPDAKSLLEAFFFLGHRPDS